MNNQHKILVIEDEVNICNFLKTIFETNNFKALFAGNGECGKMMFHSHNPDVIILDLGLPDMDGNDFISMVRASSDTPIIVLSARSGESDKVKALDLGANDYITKPFGTNELLARVRAALRTRVTGNIGSVRERFVLDELVIDYASRTVTLGGEEIRFTQTEYNILELLSIYVDRVLTYSEIIKKVWGYSDSGSVKKLQVNMANIRKKLGENPGEYRFILNDLGVGYRMRGSAAQE